MNFYLYLRYLNRLLGGGKGNILQVEFSVGKKIFKAFVPDDQLWISIKDCLISREYEFLPEFEIGNFKNGIVIDVRAHVGLFSLIASCFTRKIIAIEAHSAIKIRRYIRLKVLSKFHNILSPLLRQFFQSSLKKNIDKQGAILFAKIKYKNLKYG